MNRRPGYSKEVRERTVRLVKTREHDHSSAGYLISQVIEMPMPFAPELTALGGVFLGQ